MTNILNDHSELDDILARADKHLDENMFKQMVFIAYKLQFSKELSAFRRKYCEQIYTVFKEVLDDKNK